MLLTVTTGVNGFPVDWPRVRMHITSQQEYKVVYSIDQWKKRLKVMDDQQGCHDIMNDKQKVIKWKLALVLVV